MDEEMIGLFRCRNCGAVFEEKVDVARSVSWAIKDITENLGGDGLPVVPGKEEEFGRAYVAVAIKDWNRSYPMYYERETVRGKVVRRWKWPWGSIYNDGNIVAWSYLPELPWKEKEND